MSEKYAHGVERKKVRVLQSAKAHVKKYGLFFINILKFIMYSAVGFLREAGILHDLNSQKLLALKGKYAGQRCFLVGNGPSLNADDLNMIAGELSFGCNMIYKIFGKTEWRPTYHFMTDTVYTKNLNREIEQCVVSTVITHARAYHSMSMKPKDTVYVYSLSRDNYQIHGNMLAYYVPSKATVMTFMTEMAIYMGFKEIYLLGVDCTNPFTVGHFAENYTSSEIDSINLARARNTVGNSKLTLTEFGDYRLERSMAAYKKIAAYAKGKGISIYNATRGGKLEVFPRKKLEDIL